MWVNKKYEIADKVAWIKQFVQENTLSTIITHSPVRVAHMPVEVIEHGTELPKLLFHMPIVDPIAQAISEAPRITVVVHGPQQYISPTFYQDIGLPTFNYGVAEIEDVCRPLSSAELKQHLYRLIEEREELSARQTKQAPWQIDTPAQERFDRLLPMLVGFEIGLENAQVKVKMGQNRTTADRQFAIERLRESDGINQTVLNIMETLPQS